MSVVSGRNKIVSADWDLLWAAEWPACSTRPWGPRALLGDALRGAGEAVEVEWPSGSSRR